MPHGQIPKVAGHLSTILHHPAPAHVTSIDKKAVNTNSSPEEILAQGKTLVSVVAKQAMALKDNSAEQVSKDEADSQSALSKIYRHVAPIGGWITTLGGQVAALITGFSNSSTGTKVIQGFTIGSTVATGAITAVVYWRYFRQQALADLRGDHASRLESSLTTLQFIHESKKLAEECLHPNSASHLQKQYHEFHGHMIHALKTTPVPKALCGAWIEAGLIIDKLDGDGQSEELQTLVHERITPLMQHFTNVHDKILDLFRKQPAVVEVKEDEEVDASAHLDVLNEHVAPAVLPTASEEEIKVLAARLQKLTKEAADLKGEKEKKVESADDSVFNTIGSHYAPVGTWIITIGGQVAAIIDDWGTSTPGTKTIEFATLAASVATGVITGIVYWRHFKNEDIKKLGGEVKDNAERVHITAQFLEKAHNFAEELAAEEHDEDKIRDDFNELRDFMLHHRNPEAIPNHLFARWIKVGELIRKGDVVKIGSDAKKVDSDGSKSSSSSNEDGENIEMKEEGEEELEKDEIFLESSVESNAYRWPKEKLQKIARTQLLPRIHHSAEHLDDLLKLIQPEEEAPQSWWRSCWPARMCFGKRQRPSDLP